MKHVKSIFLKGLLAVVPVVLTLSLIVWLVRSFESLLAPVIQWLIPGEFYIPGLGVVAAILFIFLLGLVLEAWVFRCIWRSIEAVMKRTPVVRDVYNAIDELVQFVSGKKDLGDGSVVFVKFGDPQVRLLGLVTQRDLSTFSSDSSGISSDMVAVYLPMSYQVGGFTVYVSKDQIESVDLSTEKALRMTLTASMNAGADNDN